jgi:hypothetical protein
VFRLRAVCLIAIVASTVGCSPRGRWDRSTLGCVDLTVPAPAVRAALENLSEYGTVDEILAFRDASLSNGPRRPLYAALVSGRFRAYGPMVSVSRAPYEMRFRRASLVFDRDGTLWRVGLGGAGPSSNPVDSRIFGACNL